ncbi:MAG: hypothetical protein LUC95_02160 [Lachnospiraceae bacterium]|nr:hypothetical protein [Lachnospiraceae bacterium]
MDNKTTACTVSEKPDPEFRELIYHLLNGSLDLEHYPIPESQYVENLFDDGKECERLYSKAFDARERLYERLNSPDDKDVDDFMICLELIGQVTSFRMFDYGWFFAHKAFSSANPD